jgi:hypothetical protein
MPESTSSLQSQHFLPCQKVYFSSTATFSSMPESLRVGNIYQSLITERRSRFSDMEEKLAVG